MTNQQQNKETKRFGLPQFILIVALGILLCGEAYFGFRLHALSSEQEQIKEDYSMSNNITFGLFSVDQWRDRITEVVNHQIGDFKMTPAQKKALQAQVEQQLHSLINKTVAEINQPQKTLGGKLKKLAFNAMVNADDIQAQVPSFAKTIVDKVNSPASTERLKNIATSKINQLGKQIYDSTSTANYEITKYEYRKYHVADPVAFNNRINSQLTAIRTVTYNYALAMLGCVVMALVLWLLMRKQVHLQTILFVMSLLFAFVLLAVGITASIIEVDARIQSFNFMLLGEKVAFENQILFFQSKSILGIVETLIKQSKPDAVLIGVLIMVFIIILPVLRLVAKGIHILSPKMIAENKVVRYLAFESAKWDMADVMVVGILMTYIGLNGILKSQLSNLNIHNSLLTTTTVNNTSLQPGYFIFVGYVVFASILSYILKRITAYNAAESKGKWR
ncbi:Paraquat-inducible protein A [Mucilaginibacter lappiensis]|uniref:Energy-converting hydrogenase Eha subunit A n=1 Tax=Mucilaginibacter lappiensis TaxID=354630 RepID=A0ABR6PCX0_9SPHI|nr:paraquat-inducible protein A [Mucilaginibacter lappiensis]MBB6107589.1 energy-converting hydrogenase Eha subunit A [Mucilaginibacter lappiensis]SIQ03508.1 Paraquat-inducible protein A [Mucilaginibacter lappiensis]